MRDNSEMLVEGGNAPQAQAYGGDLRAVLIVEDSENSASTAGDCLPANSRA